MRLHQPVALHSQPHLGIPMSSPLEHARLDKHHARRYFQGGVAQGGASPPSPPTMTQANGQVTTNNSLAAAGAGFARGGPVRKRYDEGGDVTSGGGDYSGGGGGGGDYSDSGGSVDVGGWFGGGGGGDYSSGDGGVSDPSSGDLVGNAQQVYNTMDQAVQDDIAAEQGGAQTDVGSGDQGYNQNSIDNIKPITNSNMAQNSNWKQFEQNARPSTNVEGSPGSETLGKLGGFEARDYTSRFGGDYATNPSDPMTRKLSGTRSGTLRGYAKGGPVRKQNAPTQGGIPDAGPGPAGPGVTPQSTRGNPGRPGWKDPNPDADRQKNFYQNVTSMPATSPSKGTSYQQPTPVGGQRGQEGQYYKTPGSSNVWPGPPRRK